MGPIVPIASWSELLIVNPAVEAHWLLIGTIGVLGRDAMGVVPEQASVDGHAHAGLFVVQLGGVRFYRHVVVTLIPRTPVLLVDARPGVPGLHAGAILNWGVPPHVLVGHWGAVVGVGLQVWDVALSCCYLMICYAAFLLVYYEADIICGEK